MMYLNFIFTATTVKYKYIYVLACQNAILMLYQTTFIIRFVNFYIKPLDFFFISLFVLIYYVYFLLSLINKLKDIF